MAGGEWQGEWYHSSSANDRGNHSAGAASCVTGGHLLPRMIVYPDGLSAGDCSRCGWRIAVAEWPAGGKSVADAHALMEVISSGEHSFADRDLMCMLDLLQRRLVADRDEVVDALRVVDTMISGVGRRMLEALRAEAPSPFAVEATDPGPPESR